VRSTVLRATTAVAVLLSTLVVAAPAAASTAPVVYTPPVDAPISDPFRPPSTPYGAGNRGVEFATAPDTPVRAAADGTVVFAGAVAGRLWLTVRHADEIRTTYGPLREVRVHSGDLVRGGDVIGTTAGNLMFTARVGDAYVDPMSLFGHGPPRVHLIREPLDIPGAPRDASGVGISGVDAVRSAVDWEVRHLGAIPEFALSLTPAPVIAAGIDALVAWRDAQGHCTPAASPAPHLGERHVAVLVGGLGSSSTNAAVADVDTTALGYAPADVVRFSYAGGRVPSAAAVARELRTVPVNSYAASDTVAGLEVAAHRFADVLRSITAAAGTNGPPVDVIAHSQGGLVVRAALQELAATDPEVLDRLGTIVTLGTPHEGADLAAAVEASRRQPAGRFTLELAAAVTDVGVAPDDPIVAELAPGSDFLAELAREPLPGGVHVVSIAARGDLVVPSPRAHLDGAVNVIVEGDGPSAHDRLPGSTAATREIALAVTGADPGCESAFDAAFDATNGTVISSVEHALSVLQGG